MRVASGGCRGAGVLFATAEDENASVESGVQQRGGMGSEVRTKGEIQKGSRGAGVRLPIIGWGQLVLVGRQRY